MLTADDVEQAYIKLDACPARRGSFLDAGEFKDFCGETVMARIKDLFAKKG